MNRLLIGWVIFAKVIGLSSELNAQNLVLNPSFENYTSCPQSISEFDKAVNWQSPYINLIGDTCSTSDLYNSCSLFGGAGVPQNLLGYQAAHTGIGYAGMILYDGFPLTIFGCTNIPTGWREYAEGTLSSPLIAGQTYCVSFYVSLPDNVKFATDDIGVYFSNTLINISCTTVGSSSVLPFSPQLEYNGPAITDTSGWTKLQWSYTATGGERYITIGNFKNDASTTYTCVNGNSVNSHAYYYLDDVEVIQTAVCCPIIMVDVASQKNVSCSGGSDGLITVNATAGASPYNYVWSTGATGATLSNRSAGSYTVTATDANGCTVSKVFSITQPQTLTVSLSSSSTSCGTSAVATPGGGTGPFTYLWSNGATVASISNLTTGTYIVTVHDANSCSAMGSINVTQTSGFTVNTSFINPSCGVCDGTVSATPVGGTGPFSYAWSGGQTTSSITGLCAGTYTVTVVESGTTGTNTFWSENFSSGGTGWTLNLNGPGANQANANQWIINNNYSDCSQCPANGSGGNYLHVTCGSGIPCFGSAGSCVYDMGVPVFSNAATDKYVTSPNISTIGKSGITLTFWYMAGGESGLDYGLVRLSNNGGSSWTDLPTQYSGTATCTQATISLPATYENIADFRIGFRWVNDNNTQGDDPGFTIDDIELSSASGTAACSASATVGINSTGGPTVTLASKTDVACYSAGSGAIDINVSGGTSPYTYSWTGGANTQDISGLSGGNYTVTVTDNVSCVGTLSVTISEPSTPLVVSGLVMDAGCGTPSGGIDLSVSGGNQPYTYLWSNGAVTQDLNGIVAGNYTVSVSDNNSCIETKSFTVNAPGNFTVTLMPDDASCLGVADGSVIASINGGTPPFQYNWSNGATTQNITGVAGGTYVFIVRDNNNCIATDTAVVDEPSDILFNTSITKTLCEDGNNGGIKLSPAGGTPPYSADWSNLDTSLSIQNLSPGVYDVTVTDANGCTRDTSIALTSVSQYQIELVVTNTSCDGSEPGSVQVNVLSPTTPPYSFVWNTSDTADIITNLTPGEYSVTVTDSLSCLRMDSAVVAVGGGLLIAEEVMDVTCPGRDDGAITVTVTGGTEPYVYVWNTGATTASLQNISEGVYTLVVTDQNDCSGSDTILVSVDSSGTIACDTVIIYDIFSPNGDGTNDLWVVDGLSSYPNNEVQIFNRWGNKVFEAKPYNNDWDGTSKNGGDLPSAAYYFILRLNDAKGTVHSGGVTLIR